MKSFWLIGLILVLAILGIIFWLKFWRPEAIKFPQPKPASIYDLSEPVFKWGVGINPYPTGDHSPETAYKVLDEAQELGVTHLRVALPVREEDPWSQIDPIAEKALEMKLWLVLVIDPKEGILGVNDPYNEGYSQAKEIAAHYKDKIKYYQLTNEPAGSAIKGSQYTGKYKEDYDDGKYQKVIEWLKGASDGIAAEDPQAKKIVTGHWTHVGFFDRATADGLNFDIIGWDWANQKKEDVVDIKDLKDENGQPYDLIGKLNSSGKELWIAEAGLNTSKNPPAVNDAYLKEFATEIFQRREFSGFFVFIFTEEMHLLERGENGGGLIGLKKDSSGKWQFGDQFQEFFTYQSLIRDLGTQK